MFGNKKIKERLDLVEMELANLRSEWKYEVGQKLFYKKRALKNEKYYFSIMEVEVIERHKNLDKYSTSNQYRVTISVFYTVIGFCPILKEKFAMKILQSELFLTKKECKNQPSKHFQG